MVVKVLQSRGSTSSPLEYNEEKVSEGEAEIIGVFNKGEDKDIYEAFKRLERRNISVKNVSFHMAINPGEGEDMTEGRICSFACDLMQGMGYGNQPFIIYRHHDIERIHYHVLSSRICENGKKVNDYWENKRCENVSKELQQKYGFVYGKTSKLKLGAPVPPRRFLPRRGEVSEQLTQLFDECIRYHFTSFAQFKNILLSHGVKLHVIEGKKKTFYLKGIDEKGKVRTAPLGKNDLNRDLYSIYSTAVHSGRLTKAQFRPEREHIERAVALALRTSWNQQEFIEALAKHDIDVVLRKGKDGKITDADFISNVNYCAVNIDEMNSLNVDMIENIENNGEKENNAINDLMDALLSEENQGRSKEKDMKDDLELKKKMKLKMKIR